MLRELLGVLAAFILLSFGLVTNVSAQGGEWFFPIDEGVSASELGEAIGGFGAIDPARTELPGGIVVYDYGVGYTVNGPNGQYICHCYANCCGVIPELSRQPPPSEPSDCPAGATMVGGGCVLNGERDRDKDRCPEREAVDVSWGACQTWDGQPGTGTQELRGECTSVQETRTCCYAGTKCGGWGECDSERKIRTRTCTVYVNPGAAMACRTTRQYTEGQNCSANISGNVFDTSVEGASCNNPLDNSTVGIKVKAVGKNPPPTGEEVTCEGKPINYASDKSGWTVDYANPEWYDPSDTRIEYIGDWGMGGLWIGDTCDWDPERGCTRRYGGYAPAAFLQTAPSRIIKYGGYWNDYFTPSYLNFYSEPKASGGGAMWIGLGGAYASLNFDGSSITYYRHTGPNEAIVEVFLDGDKVDELDNYSASEQWQIKQTYTTTPGSHTIKVYSTGRVNPQATGGGLVIDAFEVDSGQLIQENDYHPAKIRVEFKGVAIEYWRAMTGFINSEDFKCEINRWTCRRALTTDLYLDGQYLGPISNVTGSYSNSTQLSNGAYGVPTSWQYLPSHPGPSAGNLHYTNYQGSSASFTFTGSSITYLYTTTTNRGIAEVFIDNQKMGEIDQYSATENWQQQTSYPNLSEGSHTITITHTGRKHPNSTNTYIDIDAFVVGGVSSTSTTYEDDHSDISYPGYDEEHVLEIVLDPAKSYGAQFNTTGFKVHKKPCTVKSKPLCEADKTTLVDSIGSYFVANLCIPDVYTMSLDSGGRFKDTIGLYCDGSNVVSLSTLGQMAVRRFGLEGGGRAWIQAEGSGNVYAQGEISNPIPQSCQGSCEPYFIAASGSLSPGIVSFGGVRADLGQGQASKKGWLANSGYEGKKYGFKFYFNQLGFGTTTQADFEGGVLVDLAKPQALKPPLSGNAYLARGDVNIANDSWQILSGEKIVVLVEGDLNISAPIRVTRGGFLAFLVKGDINIDPSLGGDGPEATIEGIYVADGVLNTSQSNVKLIVAGVYVGWGGVNLERSLPGGRNKTEPAEVFRYRPDLMVNMPQFMKRPSISWEEVAP